MFRLSNKKALDQGSRCKVQLLVPGEELEVDYNSSSTGQDIFNEVVNHLTLLDKDYYGLKLHDSYHWLDLNKSVMKQTKGLGIVIFVLRFKYYPAEPALLANELTRYYLYLQLRSDLLEGRLRSDSLDTLAYLIACVLQTELNNADSSPQIIENTGNYAASYKFVPNQTEELELEAIGLHKSEDFIDLRPSESELNFLKKACQLETYGIDPYPVKDSNSRNHFLLGVNHLGISTFQDSKRTSLFAWNELERISLDGKLIVIYCQKVEKKGEKLTKIRSLFAFRCPSQEHAESFWKISNEHKFFFTLESTPQSPIKTNTRGLFKKTHTLKYTGRVEKDLLRDHVDETRSTSVKRSRSLMVKNSNGQMWQGFKQGKNDNLQAQTNNIYTSSDNINKTLPAGMNYFIEEERSEEQDNKQGRSPTRAADRDLMKPKSSTDSITQSAAANNFERRQVLTSKAEACDSSRRHSQVYMDMNEQKDDFIKASVFLLLGLLAIFISILLIDETDRPNSIAYLLKRLNLERVAQTMRYSYYLPLKSTLKTTFEHVLTVLDSRLL